MGDGLDSVTERLDTIISLLQISVLEGKTQREQIELLSKVGLPPRKIAEVIQTTSNTVRVALAVMRKKRKKPGTRQRKE